jgi:hypothetical protein
MLKQFIYTSATACHTSLIIKGKVVDLSLYKGEAYELPATDHFVKLLVSQGLLITFKKLKKEK